MDKLIVIAKYKEDIGWTKALADPVIIYDKSCDLPNVGREAHTYLHHIIQNYNSLNDVTVFTQADPFSHRADFLKWLNQSFSHWTPFVTIRSRKTKEWTDDLLVDSRLGRPHGNGIRIGEFYEKLFLAPSPGAFAFSPGAIFAVTRAEILAHRRGFYERAIDLCVNFPKGAWILERLWKKIFTGKPV
jgi:hypothetical protein